MPGQIRQWTPDEVAKFEAFPLPVSGRVTLAPIINDRYLVDCANVSGNDLKRLEEFWNRMEGGIYPFRYESKTYRFPHCCFCQDTARFIVHGPNRCRAQFVVEVLPPYET